VVHLDGSEDQAAAVAGDEPLRQGQRVLRARGASGPDDDAAEMLRFARQGPQGTRRRGPRRDAYTRSSNTALSEWCGLTHGGAVVPSLATR